LRADRCVAKEETLLQTDGAIKQYVVPDVVLEVDTSARTDYRRAPTKEIVRNAGLWSKVRVGLVDLVSKSWADLIKQWNSRQVGIIPACIADVAKAIVDGQLGHNLPLIAKISCEAPVFLSAAWETELRNFRIITLAIAKYDRLVNPGGRVHNIVRGIASTSGKWRVSGIVTCVSQRDLRLNSKERSEAAAKQMVNTSAIANGMAALYPAAVIFELLIGLNRRLRSQKVCTGGVCADNQVDAGGKVVSRIFRNGRLIGDVVDEFEIAYADAVAEVAGDKVEPPPTFGVLFSFRYGE